jgi:DNA-binding beta-propeller fold protein YncE
MTLWLATSTAAVVADEPDTAKVGMQSDGRVVVPTNQILKPAGTAITFPGRPVDLALTDDGKTLVIKNLKNLVFIDVAQAKVRQTLASPVGFSVVGLLVRRDRIYVSDAQDHVRVAEKQPDGTYKWLKPIKLTPPSAPGAGDEDHPEKPPDESRAHPAGMAWQSETEFWVTSTRGNNVQLVDAETGKLKQTVAVGVAPYTICCPRPGRCYVSNWGGDLPAKDDPQLPSSKTPVRVDKRTNVANHGSVSVLEEVDGKWRQTKTIRVGLHPCGLVTSPHGRFVYVANATSDEVSVLGGDKLVASIPCRPEARLPFGSGPNALALGPDQRLYVANGTNNCIAVLQLAGNVSETDEKDAPQASRLLGLIPTAWYPGAVLLSAEGKKLFVANVKGYGALSQPRAREKGLNSHDHLGVVSIVDIPDEKQLAAFTKEVNANNRLAYSLAGLEKPRPDVKPVPVPARHGEPSVFKHVVYVIKENRTYDQVLGDMKEGNGEPKLCIFGEEVTPNHHALARQFTLFDNFYCSGVLSADGHSWVNEAYVTDYLEKSFGGFTRSYPYEGSDPLAFAPCGFLWDNALAHKKSFRNYGEFVKSTYTEKGLKWVDVYNDFKQQAGKVKHNVKPNLPSLAPHTRAGYPGFVMTTPDVVRASMFVADLKDYEKKGEFPNLVYVYLPCDHTSGTRPDAPTPRAMVADNDLALGQVVEAISKSKFWPDTCIFVVEDDPQNGFDHVDGHRTVALVISPYTKRKFVDHTNYNQTGMVKTIEMILGLPPMNQLDLSATPLRGCFQDKPDLTPYRALASKIALDEMNPPLKKLDGPALRWAKESIALDLDDADAADEDTLNRILWHSVRGYQTPYPAQFAGSARSPGNTQKKE